jgi:hypothetical protein
MLSLLKIQWMLLAVVLYIYLPMALQSFVGPWQLFSSLTWSQSVEFLGRGISLSPCRYLHTEQHRHRINAHNTDIHALSGIRTHDPSVWASEDSSCLRPCIYFIILVNNRSVCTTHAHKEQWGAWSPKEHMEIVCTSYYFHFNGPTVTPYSVRWTVREVFHYAVLSVYIFTSRKSFLW